LSARGASPASDGVTIRTFGIVAPAQRRHHPLGHLGAEPSRAPQDVERR
jgi:hypothetical protein